jgi:hypothetical protein
MKWWNKPDARIERTEALHKLEADAASGRAQAIQVLTTIDALLFYTNEFAASDLKRILRKNRYPPKIREALKLYAMMARLTRLCEPRGNTVGPSCVVKLIDFENLSETQLYDLKGANWIFFRLGVIGDEPLTALSILSPGEKALYKKAKPFFVPPTRPTHRNVVKPTLRSLAANILRKSTASRSGFSDASVVRYIKDLRRYSFAHKDPRRDYLIRSVDEFGADKQTVRELINEFASGIMNSLGSVDRSIR